NSLGSRRSVRRASSVPADIVNVGVVARSRRGAASVSATNRGGPDAAEGADGEVVGCCSASSGGATRRCVRVQTIAAATARITTAAAASPYGHSRLLEGAV